MRFTLAAEFGLDQGEEAVQRCGRSDGAMERAALTVSHDVLRGIMETNAISRAMSAEQFHVGGGEISL